MNFIGVDLHKKIITVCVMDQKLKILARTTLYCDELEKTLEFFRNWGPFKVVVEATASYSWFVKALEPLAQEIVLANPKKLRVIAESTKKTDRLDAQILAEFLARDMVPRAYLPTPRQREHRTLVRHRQHLRGRITSVCCKIRHILADYNADRRDLFSSQCGLAYIKQVGLDGAQKTVVLQLWTELQEHEARLDALVKKIKAFIKKAPQREAEARKILKTAPGVGFVTAEVILSELGEVSRFRNAKAVSAYAGLAPTVRQSGGKKSKDLRITKEGSGLLRWALVEAAWRLVAASPKWERRYERLKKRGGAKRAIVAIARKLLCVLYAMLRTSTPYSHTASWKIQPAKPTRKRLVRKTTAEPTVTS
jgi:transposase